MTNHNEETALSPKVSTVDKLITLPGDIEKVIAGEKTANRRNGRHADVGEIMTLQGRHYVIERVYVQMLGDLTDEHAGQEGFANVEEYKQAIVSMHPGMPWLPEMRVWVHEFRPIGE